MTLLLHKAKWNWEKCWLVGEIVKEKFGLEINKIKTKVMKSSINGSRDSLNITIGNGSIQVGWIQLLGNIITKDRRNEEEHQEQTALSKKSFSPEEYMLLSNIGLGVRQRFLKWEISHCVKPELQV